MTNKQIIVLLILVIYMAVNMIVGLKASKLPAKNQKTGSFLQNYFVGGRSMGGLVPVSYTHLDVYKRQKLP